MRIIKLPDGTYINLDSIDAMKATSGALELYCRGSIVRAIVNDAEKLAEAIVATIDETQPQSTGGL